MRNHLLKLSVVCIMLGLTVGVMLPANSVQYTNTIRNYRVTAPKLTGALGQKMTASGGAALKGPDMDLTADTITWNLTSQNKIQSVEANGNVVYRVNQTSATGSKVVANGDGAKVVYNLADGKAVITGSANRKAYLHTVESPVAQTGVAPGHRTSEIRAETINYDIKSNTFEANGGVEIEYNVPEAPKAPKTVKTTKTK